MAIVEAEVIFLPKEQQPIGQRCFRRQKDQSFRPDVACGMPEQGVAAVDIAHRHRLQSLDGPIDDSGLDCPDMTWFDAKAFPVGNQG